MIDANGTIYQDLTKILVTREEIAAKVRELGQKITEDYRGKSPVMVCVVVPSAS